MCGIVGVIAGEKKLLQQSLVNYQPVARAQSDYGVHYCDEWQ